MHQSRPYGLHVIGEPLTKEDQSFISATAKRFTNMLNISKIESLKLVYELPDGGSFIIQDMGGNFRVIAHKPIYNITILDFDGLAKADVPMLFSGAVAANGLVREGDGLRLNLSELTRKRLLGYVNGYAPKSVSLVRFACKYGPQFQEFMPERPINGLIYTQYIHQRPTWYSGAMAEVMQIVGGYGRQDLDKLPDDKIERATFYIPPSFQQKIEEELKQVRLPCYSGLPNEDGQFQCDYKFFQTNLVTFDKDNKPWLVKVDNSGVWSMPLPMVPASMTDAFRLYIEGVGDSEILAILDRFGGMPSGESFPVGSAFQDWRRAGVIIKVCDTKDFYSHLPYSSAMGWSANTTGTELVNTCYELDFETGKITSRTYKIRLELGSAINQGWIKSRTSADIAASNQSMGYINRYLQFIYEQIKDNNSKNLAIKYKINQTSLIDIGVRARRNYDDKEIDYWQNLEITPIATHKGNTTKIDEGIYFGGHGVKVPEPMLGGCVSLPIPQASDREGKKDTTVLAYYIDDSLKTVKIFADDRPHQYEIETNFETYMYVGKWFSRELIGGARVIGNIYTSDIDDRFISAPTEVEVNIDGKDLGFGGAILQMDHYFWKTGTLSRSRYYTEKTHTKTTRDKSMSLAAAIPYFCRNGLLYAKTIRSASVWTKERLALGEVRDPHSYRIWSYSDTKFNFGSLPVMNGTPFPVRGRPVYAEILEYKPHESNDWANDGDWVGDLPADVTPLLYDYSNVVWAFRAAPPPPPANEYTKIEEIKETQEQELKCQIYDGIEKVRKGYHSDLYYSLLPDAYMNTLDENACKVLFGSKRYANISEANETGNRKQWGESTLVDNKSAHHFIGVINE